MAFITLFFSVIVIIWLIITRSKEQEIKTVETKTVETSDDFKISDPNNKDEVESYRLFMLGQKCYDRKEFSKAIEYYSKAINYKKHWVFFNNRGCAKAHLELFGSAIDDFIAAISLDSEKSIIFLNRGWVYFTIEKQDLSCKDWRRAAKLGSERAQELTKQYCPRIGTQEMKINQEPIKPKKRVFQEEEVLEPFSLMKTQTKQVYDLKYHQLPQGLESFYKNE